MLRGLAWRLIALVELGFVLWGAMAALAPEQLPGPGGAPILPAGFRGFTGASWAALAAGAPKTAAYLTLLFRVYGAYNLAFGVTTLAIACTAFRRGELWAWWTLLAGDTIALGSAMAYDRIVHAIGPFELSEYVGLALVYASLAATAPFSIRANAGPNLGPRGV